MWHTMKRVKQSNAITAIFVENSDVISTFNYFYIMIVPPEVSDDTLTPCHPSTTFV
jgi:hypothetical protein